MDNDKSIIQHIYADVAEASLYAEKENWDGYGASPIDAESMARALEFADQYLVDGPRPDVGVDPDGEVCFGWGDYKPNVVSVSFFASGNISYAGRLNGDRRHGVSLNGQHGDLIKDIRMCR